MCAWVCHPNKNTPALTRSNLVSEYKIEKEANYFATKLLVDGSHIEDFVTGKYDVLRYYGLPKSFKRFLWTFFNELKDNQIEKFSNEFEIARDFYLKTVEFSSYATDPQGSYTSFSDGFATRRDEISSKYSSVKIELDIE